MAESDILTTSEGAKYRVNDDGSIDVISGNYKNDLEPLVVDAHYWVDGLGDHPGKLIITDDELLFKISGWRRINFYGRQVLVRIPLTGICGILPENKNLWIMDYHNNKVCFFQCDADRIATTLYRRNPNISELIRTSEGDNSGSGCMLWLIPIIVSTLGLLASCI